MDVSSPVLVAGTGAMACLFAARLVASGRPVRVLGTWPEGLQALREHGVRLIDADGEERAYPVQIADNPENCTGIHYALVLVKSWQTVRAARQLAAYLEPQGVALTLQNGLDNRQVLETTLGSARVALGVTTIGATLVEPGRVRFGGSGMISLGEHPRLQPLADLLTAARFPVEMVTDTQALLWGKAVINAAINPLTALLRVQNGELLERPTAQALLGMAAREAAAVAEASGVRLPYADPVEVVENVARRTGSNTSSMLRDVLRGAPTEIDSINGFIVQCGERVGVPAPLTRTLWQLVKSLVERSTTEEG